MNDGNLDSRKNTCVHAAQHHPTRSLSKRVQCLIAGNLMPTKQTEITYIQNLCCRRTAFYKPLYADAS
jgi:hypothetical protein